jgi:hypothetical protein
VDGDLGRADLAENVLAFVDVPIAGGAESCLCIAEVVRPDKREDVAG